jgi:hypothetical protein
MGIYERGLIDGSGYQSWMHRRQTIYCDEVDPVQVDFVNGEHVVWARRKGISEQGYFDFYHIGCDCLGDVPFGESEIEAMLGCNAVGQFLVERADDTARDIFHLDQILPYFIYEEGSELQLDDKGEKIAKKFVFEALFKTLADSERCHGNIRTGVHVKPILRRMLGGISDTQLDIILGSLEEEGAITVEDPLVVLPIAA